MALPDLDTRSVLNVVDENFRRLGLKTYAIRMIYAGEHTLNKGEIIKLFQKSVSDVNSSYCEVEVTGLLLVYDSCFVHILEGSEDTVNRQLRFLLKLDEEWIKQTIDNVTEESATEDNTEEGLSNILEHKDCSKPEMKVFKRLKGLMVYHSIQTRMFNGWRALTARPPSLVGNLDVNIPFADHMELLRIFLNKIGKLCVLAKNDPDLSFEGLSAVDPKIEALPEVMLLVFLLESQYILELRRVVHLHRRVDDYVYYCESVWPLRTHYTPRMLYKLKVDDTFVEPLPVMPWEVVKREIDEEGKDTEREEQSDASSSD